MKKIKVKINKPVYLGLSILEISKTLMYEFWYDYIKPSYGYNAELCDMDTDSFIIHLKTEYVYDNIENDVEKTLHKEKRLHASNNEINRQLTKAKNKEVIGLMKDKLSGKIITKFVGLRGKTYSYVIDYGSEDKTAKGTKKCVIKRILKFEDYKNSLQSNKIILKLQF